MKTKAFTKFLILSLLAIPIVAGCSNGKNGATGPAGQQGAQGQQGATGPTGPTVTWVMPVQGSTGVYTDSVIKVGFSKPISSSTINTSTFIVSTGGVNVTGTVSYNSGSQTAFFDPYMPLAQFGFYTATLTTGIKDTEGNQLLESYTWTFFAGGSLTPSRLYVADDFAPSVSVFNNANSADGNVFPDSLLSGGPLSNPWRPQLDKASDRLYVSDQGNAVFVFNNASAIKSGTAAPARTISGASTTLNNPTGMFLDTANDRLYVANFGGASVLVFDNVSTKNGNVAPDRTISGANTTFSYPIDVWVDTARDILYVYDRLALTLMAFNNASTINGNVAPNRTVSGSNTGFSFPGAIWYDSSNDRLYLSDQTALAVYVFNSASTINGNIAPDRTITGSNTTFADPIGLWLDAASDRLYVADAGSKVLVFNSASTINGNVAPSRTIAGANTGFSGPLGLWLDMNP
jgi:Bacterial Ig-like domain